jgi:hypothetical protein
MHTKFVVSAPYKLAATIDVSAFGNAENELAWNFVDRGPAMAVEGQSGAVIGNVTHHALANLFAVRMK